jgi:hypothetical protein
VNRSITLVNPTCQQQPDCRAIERRGCADARL